MTTCGHPGLEVQGLDLVDLGREARDKTKLVQYNSRREEDPEAF